MPIQAKVHADDGRAGCTVYVRMSHHEKEERRSGDTVTVTECLEKKFKVGPWKPSESTENVVTGEPTHYEAFVRRNPGDSSAKLKQEIESALKKHFGDEIAFL